MHFKLWKVHTYKEKIIDDSTCPWWSPSWAFSREMTALSTGVASTGVPAPISWCTISGHVTNIATTVALGFALVVRAVLGYMTRCATVVTTLSRVSSWNYYQIKRVTVILVNPLETIATGNGLYKNAHSGSKIWPTSLNQNGQTKAHAHELLFFNLKRTKFVFHCSDTFTRINV